MGDGLRIQMRRWVGKASRFAQEEAKRDALPTRSWSGKPSLLIRNFAIMRKASQLPA
jgi:hypothetical protein